MRRSLPLAAAALAAAAFLPADAPAQDAASCPGAQPACPYVAAGTVGQRGGGVLRFPQAIAIGPDQSVYVGDQGSHTVQVFGPDGTFRREVGLSGSRPGELSAVGALAVAPDGTLYVADGKNRIDRFGADGGYQSSFGKSGTGLGALRFGGGRGNDAGAGGGLAVGGGGVYVSDSGNDRIQRFDLNGTNPRVIVPPGSLRNPKGIAIRKTRLLVADDQNHRVLAMDLGGRLLKTIGAAKGTKPGQLNFPYGVAADGPGRVFVADNLNHRVARFSTQPNYPYKGRFGSYGQQRGQLAYPRGIAVDGAGMVYVANTGNDRIEVFDNGGKLIRAFGSSGRGQGQFNTPVGVASDASGTRAVVDSINGRVEFFDPAGKYLTAWGSPAPGPTILPRPVDVGFDPSGNAYVLDQRRARIIVFSRQTGQPVRQIGSQGSGPGQMLDPSAMVVASNGTIWVADTGNKRIMRYSTGGQALGALTGKGAVHGIALSPQGDRTYVTAGNSINVYDPSGERITTFGGTGNKLGKLNAPAQLVVDASGDLWVADRGNNRVQQFGPDGERKGTFGTRGTGTGQFVNPTGIDLACNGVLSVTDTGNNRLQQFALAAPSAAPCSALPALGTPPAPKLPTMPVTDGPQLTLRALRATGLLSSKRQIPVRAGCDTTCSVAVTVTVTPKAAPQKRGKKPAKRVTIAVKAKPQPLGAGGSAIIRPALSKTQAAQLRRALAGKRALVVTIQATASGSVGEPTTVVQRVEGRA